MHAALMFLNIIVNCIILFKNTMHMYVEEQQFQAILSKKKNIVQPSAVA